MRKMAMAFGLLVAGIWLTAGAVCFAQPGDPQADAVEIDVRNNAGQIELRDPVTGNWTASMVIDAKKLKVTAGAFTIKNSTGAVLTVDNTFFSNGPLRPDDIIPNGGSSAAQTTFVCDQTNVDAGQWIFLIGDGVGAKTEASLTVNVVCNAVPGASSLGVLLLSVVLVAGGVMALGRRRGSAMA